MNPSFSALHAGHHERWAVDTSFQLVPARPLLHEVLDELRPLPRGALFLGQAEDGLPVLINLHDPTPGPVLIVGEKSAGKTGLLRLIAQFVISTQTPGQVQFAVLTNRAEEWQERLADAPHCVGVFYSQEPAARQLLCSLELWVSRAGVQQQSVLLLIDDLKAVLDGDASALPCLRQILTKGPSRRVWPIATTRPSRDACWHEWISLSCTRITAFDQADHNPLRLTDGLDPLRSPKHPWFTVTKNGKQILFWIPALGF